MSEDDVVNMYTLLEEIVMRDMEAGNITPAQASLISQWLEETEKVIEIQEELVESYSYLARHPLIRFFERLGRK
jgi:hypothetical protein